MTLTTIQRTRKGFLFQDVYALREIIQALVTGNLQTFSTDYMFDPDMGLSVDILLSERPKKVRVFEVKTGDKFKDDNEEIVSALVTLYRYHVNPKTIKGEYFIVTDKVADKRIVEWIAAIRRIGKRSDAFVLGRGNNGDRIKGVIAAMKSYQEGEYAVLADVSDADIRGFLKKVDIVEYIGDHASILNDCVKYITHIAKSIQEHQSGSVASVTEEHIVTKMLYHLQSNAGVELPCVVSNPLIDAIIDGTCRQRTSGGLRIEPHKDPSRQREDIMHDIRNKLARKYNLENDVNTVPVDSYGMERL